MSLADGSKNRINPSRKSKKPTIKRLAKRIQNVYKNLKQEMKIHDTVINFTPSWDNSDVNLKALCGIAQGDSDITRDGLQINVKSIQVKGIIYMNPNTGNQSSTVRMIIFRDNNFLNNLLPTPAMLLESGFGGVLAPFAMRNRRERERFKVIYDKLFTLNNNGANTLPFNIYRKVNTKVTYNDVNNGSWGKNQFFILFLSGYASTDANRPTVQYLSRVAFTDS